MMQTTRQVLEKLKGSKIILCSNCKRSMPMVDFTDRQREDDIIEIGLECPNCQHWFHSFFLNDELTKDRPKPTDNRRIRREYKLKFDKFQKQIRKRFGLRKVNGQWL